MKKLNIYLFYALALFPILDFAILNIITALFFITLPFDLKTFTKVKNETVFFIIFLFILTTIPFLIDDFKCSVSYWIEKVLPLYISSILLLLVPRFITNKEYASYRNIYVIGAILYLIKFIVLILIEGYRGKLEIIFEKKFLFYSDIVNLLGSELDILDSNYHKPYFSLIILLALFFTTKKLVQGKQKIVNFILILFFLAAIVFPLSLPNIALVFIYLLSLIFFLFKKKEIILSSTLLICISSFLLFSFYKSFEHNNLDITEDVGFILDYVKGESKDTTISELNPRKIIYSALLEEIEQVPFFGFGYCVGKKTVTNIIEESIIKTNTETSRNNLLISTESIDNYLWQKNGVQVNRNDSLFSVTPIFNNCQSHTFYQVVDELIVDEFYTLSVSVKSKKSYVVFRLGEINNQMVVFDTSNKLFSYIGKDIIAHSVRAQEKDFYRITITTKVKKPKNLALIGFTSENNQYNHCFNDEFLKVKEPQLELGKAQTDYSKGFSKNENNILGSNINAHNVFLQEYYLGGIIGLLSVILLYGWFLFLGVRGGDKLLFIYVLAIIFNSLFENIQYRQIGISIIIVISILLIFKKKE